MTPGQWLERMMGWRELLTLEPLDGYWLDNPSWGQRIAMPRNVSGLGGPGQLVPIGRLDRIPGPPRPYTVRLYRTGGVADAGSAAGNFPIIRAKITVGCGGQNTSFWCDFAHGTQFSVVASSIVVEAVQESLMGLSTNQPVELAAAFGQGACAHSNATYTFMPAPPAAVPGVVIVAAVAQIPQYATHVEVYATSAGVPNRDPLNHLRQGAVNVATDLLVSPFSDPELRNYPGVRLHPETNFITLRCLLGTVPWTFCSVIFNLGAL